MNQSNGEDTNNIKFGSWNRPILKPYLMNSPWLLQDFLALRLSHCYVPKYHPWDSCWDVCRQSISRRNTHISRPSPLKLWNNTLQLFRHSIWVTSDDLSQMLDTSVFFEDFLSVRLLKNYQQFHAIEAQILPAENIQRWPLYPKFAKREPATVCID